MYYLLHSIPTQPLQNARNVYNSYTSHYCYNGKDQTEIDLWLVDQISKWIIKANRSRTKMYVKLTFNQFIETLNTE